MLRWRFGRALIAERRGRAQLPNGRLDQVAETLGRSRSEIKQRIWFAEACETEDEVVTVVTTYGYESWTALRADLRWLRERRAWRDRGVEFDPPRTSTTRPADEEELELPELRETFELLDRVLGVLVDGFDDVERGLLTFAELRERAADVAGSVAMTKDAYATRINAINAPARAALLGEDE
jgi:hypothetical protein